MNLRNLTDDILRAETKKAAARERKTLTEVLHHLKEVARRRLWTKWGHQSLCKYAEDELKYPGDQAYRRIAAMKLLREFPQIEEKIVSGDLTMTHLNDLKTLFNKKNYSKTGKLELIDQVSKVSSKQAQKILLNIAPKDEKPDKMQSLGNGKVEFSFTGTEELADLLKDLKGRFAHINPNMSLGQLIEILARKNLELPKETPRQKPASKAGIRRRVRIRDQNKCTNCNSTYAIESDHVITRADGGDDSYENLRLLCRTCNQRAAIERFGLEKMEPFLSGEKNELTSSSEGPIC